MFLYIRLDFYTCGLFGRETDYGVICDFLDTFMRFSPSKIPQCALMRAWCSSRNGHVDKNYYSRVKSWKITCTSRFTIIHEISTCGDSPISCIFIIFSQFWQFFVWHETTYGSFPGTYLGRKSGNSCSCYIRCEVGLRKVIEKKKKRYFIRKFSVFSSE